MLSPLDPRRPLHVVYVYSCMSLSKGHMLYMFIAASCHCPKGILGPGGGGGVVEAIKTSDKNRLLCQMVFFIVHQLYKNIYFIVIDHLSTLV